MPIETISGDTAWQNLRDNPAGKWPNREKADRLYPVATPGSRPKFSISPSDRIFCVGSCFAREVEHAFRNLGFDVLSIIKNLPQSPRRQRSDSGSFNKYTAAAIVNELRWALDPAAYSEEQVLIENEVGLFEDYQLSGANYSDTLEDARAFRAGFNEAFKVIREADVVVVTLGLSEAWIDRQSGLYLNMAPSRKLVKKYPGRFELHVFDYAETLAMLEQMHALLHHHLKPDCKILITVSPVPMLATYRDADILVANAYSKAVLRAVVEKFQSDKPNVSYFPSYEFVTLSNPTTVWDDKDFRHVNRFFVQHIMASVLSSFCEQSRAGQEMAVLSKASALYRGRFFKEARAVMLPIMQQPELIKNPKLRVRWKMINRQLTLWMRLVKLFEPAWKPFSRKKTKPA